MTQQETDKIIRFMDKQRAHRIAYINPALNPSMDFLYGGYSFKPKTIIKGIVVCGNHNHPLFNRDVPIETIFKFDDFIEELESNGGIIIDPEFNNFMLPNGKIYFIGDDNIDSKPKD